MAPFQIGLTLGICAVVVITIVLLTMYALGLFQPKNTATITSNEQTIILPSTLTVSSIDAVDSVNYLTTQFIAINYENADTTQYSAIEDTSNYANAIWKDNESTTYNFNLKALWLNNNNNNNDYATAIAVVTVLDSSQLIYQFLLCEFDSDSNTFWIDSQSDSMTYTNDTDLMTQIQNALPQQTSNTKTMTMNHVGSTDDTTFAISVSFAL